MTKVKATPITETHANTRAAHAPPPSLAPRNYCRRCVLVDTVGFIQDLPTDLVLSFKSTLEEVKHADVLLHVRDASVEPRVYEAQRRAVEETLGELGASGVPTLEVWNKADKDRKTLGAPSSPSADALVHGCGGGDGGGGRAGDPGSDMSLPDELDGGTPEGVGGRAANANANARGTDLGFLDADSSSSSGTNGSSRSAADGGQENDAGRGDSAPPKSGPDDRDAVRVSAATGQGLAQLLERLDAMLHLSSGEGGGGGGRRFAAKPVDRYQYVRVLPGQSQRR